MSAPTPGILLDIEGTTSSVAFVYDEMFPFARHGLSAFLNRHWQREDVQAAVERIAVDTGHASFQAWHQSQSDDNDAKTLVINEVTRLMDADVKATGLKMLQGLIWQGGFESGDLKAHVYPDVEPALRRWSAAACDIRIYSSGSIQAQKLFFAHTTAGDLLPFFSGHYDTTTGPKREAESYRRIAADFRMDPAQITFYSDVPAELDAARAIGMQTRLCCRPGNAQVENGSEHTRVEVFP